VDEIQKIQGFVDDIATIHSLQSRILRPGLTIPCPRKSSRKAQNSLSEDSTNHQGSLDGFTMTEKFGTEHFMQNSQPAGFQSSGEHEL
jgi:hypothetical protein